VCVVCGLVGYRAEIRMTNAEARKNDECQMTKGRLMPGACRVRRFRDSDDCVFHGVNIGLVLGRKADGRMSGGLWRTLADRGGQERSKKVKK
jgi:hypothetical protein